jgi:hypothetical protein
LAKSCTPNTKNQIRPVEVLSRFPFFPDNQTYNDNQCQPNKEEIKIQGWHSQPEFLPVENLQNRIIDQGDEYQKQDDQIGTPIVGHDKQVLDKENTAARMGSRMYWNHRYRLNRHT